MSSRLKPENDRQTASQASCLSFEQAKGNIRYRGALLKNTPFNLARTSRALLTAIKQLKITASRSTGKFETGAGSPSPDNIQFFSVVCAWGWTSIRKWARINDRLGSLSPPVDSHEIWKYWGSPQISEIKSVIIRLSLSTRVG